MGKESKIPTPKIAVRFAIPLLMALTAFSLVGCDSGDDEAASSVPLAQRFPTAADAPGTKPDPVEKRQLTADLDEFIAALSERAVDPDREEMTTVFQEAGFEGAGQDARFFGEKHKPTARHLFSSIIELESEDGARSALDWLETDSMKPCPESCAVQVSTFDVDGVADARGVHRTATAEDIESFGTEDQQPFDSYWVGFTEGAFVYAVELKGRPGSVSEEEAQKIAGAYYDRLQGI
jgi:hypothetical protein